MEQRYYTAAGQIDHEAIKAYAGELRRQAIDAFWSDLMRRAAARWIDWHRTAAAHRRASPLAHPGA